MCGSDGRPNDLHPYQEFDVLMEDLQVVYGEVRRVLINLDGFSSPGSDGMHPMVLKICPDEIALSLMFNFQKSLISGWLPYE